VFRSSFTTATPPSRSGRVLLVQLEAAELLGLLDVADRQGAEQIGGQDVHGHHPLVHADGNDRPRGAVGGGGEVEALAASQARGEDGEDRVAVRPGSRPAEEVSLAALGDQADLLVVAGEEAEDGTHRLLSGEHRARDRAHLARRRLAGRVLTHGGAEARAHETRPQRGGSRQRDHALDRQASAAEQGAKGDHVLIAERPGGARATDRREQVDVEARRARRVGPRELLDRDGRVDALRDLPAGGHAQEGRALAELRCQVQAQLEVVAALRDHHRGVRCQGLAVHGVDEQRVGPGLGEGDLAERPFAERRPEPGLDQQAAHRLSGEGARIAAAGERFEVGALRGPGLTRPLGVAEADRHRLEHTAGAAVDRGHLSGPGRREADTRAGAVLEQQLTARDLVALFYCRARAQAVMVVSHQRHLGDGRRHVDLLLGLTRNGQIEPPADPVHGHASPPGPDPPHGRALGRGL
jgi:hypothetical protein